MNDFEIGLRKYFKEEELARIRGVRIGIAGAGGLGSNCAFNLVRCGFSNFVIVDYDIVEGSNLNRQFFFCDQVGKSKVEMLKENLLRINPEIGVDAVNKKIEKNNIRPIFKECDVVVEAFDKASYKKLIVETYMNSKKLLVAASGMGGFGNSDKIITRKVRDNFYIVGDFISEVNDTCPPFSPSVNIAAAKQADAILSYILSNSKGTEI